MTEAMPFLQKAILLSYDPRPFREEDFLFERLQTVPLAPSGNIRGKSTAAVSLDLQKFDDLRTGTETAKHFRRTAAAAASVGDERPAIKSQGKKRKIKIILGYTNSE